MDPLDKLEVRELIKLLQSSRVTLQGTSKTVSVFSKPNLLKVDESPENTILQFVWFENNKPSIRLFCVSESDLATCTMRGASIHISGAVVKPTVEIPSTLVIEVQQVVAHPDGEPESLKFRLSKNATDKFVDYILAILSEADYVIVDGCRGVVRNVSKDPSAPVDSILQILWTDNHGTQIDFLSRKSIAQDFLINADGSLVFRRVTKVSESAERHQEVTLNVLHSTPFVVDNNLERTFPVTSDNYAHLASRTEPVESSDYHMPTDAFHLFSDIVKTSLAACQAAGKLKRSIFYGDPDIDVDDVHTAMSQTIVRASEAPNGQDLQKLKSITPTRKRLLHSVLGVLDEVGEFTAALVNHILYDEGYDEVNVLEEIGDANWYFSIPINLSEKTLTYVLLANNQKLFARYPEKFTQELALNRNLRAEREELESCAIDAATVDLCRAIEAERKERES